MAFGELATCRPIGMGVGPIPWDTIVNYGTFHGLDRGLLKPFISIIMGLDRMFLERVSSKATPKPTPKKT